MALKRSEKMLVGIGMAAGGLALVIGLGLPQFDGFMANNSEASSINEDLKGMEQQKTNLQVTISLLKKNTDIPPGITIRTFNAQNREEVIKAMLDQVVRLATGTGNKFISLAPSAEAPVVPKPPSADKPATPTADANTASATGDANKVAALPAPILQPFGYDLSIRGSYDSLQSFLKQLDTQKELMEVSGITLENEANSDGPKSPDQLTDPNYPLRLTANLRLVLQPQDTAVSTAPTAPGKP